MIHVVDTITGITVIIIVTFSFVFADIIHFLAIMFTTFVIITVNTRSNNDPAHLLDPARPSGSSVAWATKSNPKPIEGERVWGFKV